jgi:hypothetical protein
MRAWHSGAKAIIATPHKLARIFYHLLKNRQEYADPSAATYEQQYRERTVKRLQRKAATLGMKLVPVQVVRDGVVA